MIFVALILASISFAISASAGLGGSLILVPTLSLILGPKEGIALSALLLGCNNIAKVFGYRRVIPLKSSIAVILLTMIGAAIGAKFLVKAPVNLVNIAIISSIFWSFLAERMSLSSFQQKSAPVLAFLAGASSGFSGTSGPLKGIALRSLNLDRLHLVGAASVVSLAGDLVKASIFLNASLLDASSWRLFLCACPIMPLAAFLGRHVNYKLGEQAYTSLFWTVMVGYSARLLIFSFS